MKIRDIIREVFNTPAPTNERDPFSNKTGWDWSDPDSVTLNFTVPVVNPKNPAKIVKLPYQLSFVADYMAPDEAKASDFLPNVDAVDPAVMDSGRYVEFVQGTGEFGKVNKTHLTGTGSSAQVYGQVLNAIDQYVKSADPVWLSFHAATSARQRMYLKLVQRFLQSNPGWNYVGHSGIFVVYKVEYFGDEDHEPVHKQPKQVQPQQEPELAEDWNKVNRHDRTDGLSKGAVSAYRREHPGSKLQTAVTAKPSKLKPGSKDAKRRKSFCSRMSGNRGPMKDQHGRPTPKALALRRWNCREDISPDMDHGGMPYANTRIQVPQELQGLEDLWDQFGRENPNIKLALGFLPVIGTGVSVIDFKSAVSKGDVGAAVLAALGLIPGFKPLTKIQQLGLTQRQLAVFNAYMQKQKAGRRINQVGSVGDWATTNN